MYFSLTSERFLNERSLKDFRPFQNSDFNCEGKALFQLHVCVCVCFTETGRKNGGCMSVSCNYVFCIVFCCLGCKLILCQFLEKPNDVTSPTWRHANTTTVHSGVLVLEFGLFVRFKAHNVFCTYSSIRRRGNTSFIKKNPKHYLCLTRWPPSHRVPL